MDIKLIAQVFDDIEVQHCHYQRFTIYKNVFSEKSDRHDTTDQFQRFEGVGALDDLTGEVFKKVVEVCQREFGADHFDLLRIEEGLDKGGAEPERERLEIDDKKREHKREDDPRPVGNKLGDHSSVNGNALHYCT